MKRYFFCGVGGSGMSPLALFLIHKGYDVSGSDRSYDQGRTPEKFAALEKAGVKLFPQDGTGVTQDIDALVVSSAVEADIPDISSAQALDVEIINRAEVLAHLFNEAKIGIAVAGTSGKSTVTGMIATILEEAGMDPSFINGGVVRNFGSGFKIGRGDVFVTETDESDGSIALFSPTVAVLNNIELDHKTMEELKALFGDFTERAGVAVLNMDNKNVADLGISNEKSICYGLDSVSRLKLLPDGSTFTVDGVSVRLQVPGRHNVMNALAALRASEAVGVDMKVAGPALAKFEGIKRRFEIVGTKNNITVIDDFGHNPDKIRATLETLKQSKGRVIVIFQPHGYGPLKMMGREIADVFGELLGKDDMLLMPEVFYAGGTADKSVSSRDVIDWASQKGVKTRHFESRDDIPEFAAFHAKPGDRIVVMGARDDSLSVFAKNILESL
ncbi:MAG: UDP-N-acetylmuramate--L-alanine ligase [Alphaproteobacteria bacterium]